MLYVLDEKIKFEEKIVNEEFKTTTLYFIAPPEMLMILPKEYLDAVSMEISIEFPTEHIDAEHATVCVSPTNKDGEDYDWHEIDLPDNEIKMLIALALNNSISKIAYELYKQDWINNNTSPAVRLNTLRDYLLYKKTCVGSTIEFDTFEEWVEEFGYGSGSLYVCYEEFCDAEYRDKDYMCRLLSDEIFIEAYFKDIGEGKTVKKYYNLVISILDDNGNRIDFFEITNSYDKEEMITAREKLDEEIISGKYNDLKTKNVSGTMSADIQVHDDNTGELLYII